MLSDSERSASLRVLLTRVGIAWAIVSALLIAINWSAIASNRFPDPDDIMRLVQVRDWLGGQGWFDQGQYRVDGSTGGVPMHWSRIVDAPIALIIGALSPMFGAAAAETAALIGVPLITLFCAMFLAARIAWRLLGAEEASFTSLVVAISVPVLFQLGPMRIDHHGWQIVCALLAVNGMMSRSPWVGGAVMGGAFALWLSISIEGLPLAAIAFAVLALRWLRTPEERQWLVSAIQSLALVSAVLFALTRGMGALATFCDAISPVHLAMFGWGALVLTFLARFESASRGVLIAGFAAAGGGALAMLLTTAPQCASGGGFSELDPIVAKYWHANVLEGMPIWRQSLTNALQFAVTPLIGLYAAYRLARRSSGPARQFWADYAMVLGGAFLISVLVSRAGAVACALAAPPLGWQLRSWLLAIRQMERPAPRMAAMVGVACALLPAMPAMVLTSAMPARASLGGAADAPIKAIDCRVQDAAQVLATLPKGEFYAPFDIAPEVLLTTDHSVVATGHHRGHAGMKVLIETALAAPDDARAALQARGSAYVALCPSLGEARLYARIAPEGFVAKLSQGETPEWLTPVDLGDNNGLKVWRVTPEPSR